MEQQLEMSRENVIYNALSIGTVSKGEEASASISGSGGSQVLNLVLPKGDKGDKGDATLIDIIAGNNVTIEKQGESVKISSALGSQDQQFQNSINNSITALQTEIAKKANTTDVVSKTGYVATDNNYSNIEKEKVTTASENIVKIVASSLKTYSTTLLTTGWTLNETTNLYEYNIAKEDITENTSVDGIMDLANQAKLSDGYTNSYNGGFKVYTSELPTENIDITFRYQLANMTLTQDTGGSENVGEN